MEYKKLITKEEAFSNLKTLISNYGGEINFSPNDVIDERVIFYLNELINCKIKFIYTPSFFIDGRGEISGPDEKSSDEIFMRVATRRVSEVDQFKFIKSHPYVYIQKLRLDNGVFEIVLAECTQLIKRTATFTITQGVLDKFDSIADKLAINKSKFVENKMRELIESMSENTIK